MLTLRNVFLLFLGVVLAGCSQQKVLNSITLPEDRALVLEALRDVETGNLEALQAKVPAEIREQVAEVLPQLQAELPKAEKLEAKLVDARFTTLKTLRHSVRQAQMTYEVSASGDYALAQFVVNRSEDKAEIQHLWLSRIEGPAASLNAFSFRGRSWVHYGVVLLALLAVGVTVWGIVRVWRSGQFKRRWLWTLGCLFGVSRITLDWSTGEFLFQLLHVQLLSAGAAKTGLIEPWFVSFSIPAVAIAALIRAARKQREAETPEGA